MVEEIEYEDETRCTHIEQESCFDTYRTVFKTVQVRHELKCALKQRETFKCSFCAVLPRLKSAGRVSRRTAT